MFVDTYNVLICQSGDPPVRAPFNNNKCLYYESPETICRLVIAVIVPVLYACLLCMILNTSLEYTLTHERKVSVFFF